MEPQKRFRGVSEDRMQKLVFYFCVWVHDNNEAKATSTSGTKKVKTKQKWRLFLRFKACEITNVTLAKRWRLFLRFKACEITIVTLAKRWRLFLRFKACAITIVTLTKNGDCFCVLKPVKLHLSL